MMPTSTQKTDGEAEVLAAIAAMPEPDRTIGEQLHTVIMANAPSLTPRTWYGMPAYSDGNKIICWFRSRKKFGERYMTLGFNDTAKLDAGTFWPISFALTKLGDDEASQIGQLVSRAAG
jgi:uncharacterized protein YdhG (YjbR/CyaY superfamily)